MKKINNYGIVIQNSFGSIAPNLLTESALLSVFLMEAIGENFMKLMFRYIMKNKLLMVFNIIGLFGFALVELGIPTVVSSMIDDGIAKQDIAYILWMGLVLLGLALLGSAGTILLCYASAKISTNVARDIRDDIFSKSQTFSHAEYDKFGISSMIIRTTNDVFQLQQFINLVLRTALLSPLMIITSISMTLYTSTSLSAVVGIAIPIMLVAIVIMAAFVKPISERQQKYLDRLNQVSRENLTGVRVIRAFRKEAYEVERFHASNKDFTKETKKIFKLMSLSQPSFVLLLNLAVLGVFIVSSHLIGAGSLEVGQMVAFMDYQFHTMFSFMLFALVFSLYPRARVSAGRITELLKEEPSIHNEAVDMQIPAGKEGTLEFDHVSFAYPHTDKLILHDISFTAKRGETVAIIGSTGCGKSTLIQLIPRLYDVTRGSVSLDGIDVRHYDLDTLRNKIGYIPQKTILFSGTIADNMRFGKHDASHEELEQAAKIAQAYDFIMDKPDQFEEMVYEGGVNMSGGQKQRMSIARAVVRQPEIYIFDDSFSALDFKTDAALRARLKEVTANSIVLIVAQRISSITEADRILVLDGGEIVGCGSHKELLKNCPVYLEIAESQLTKEELEKWTR